MVVYPSDFIVTCLIIEDWKPKNTIAYVKPICAAVYKKKGHREAVMTPELRILCSIVYTNQTVSAVSF